LVEVALVQTVLVLVEVMLEEVLEEVGRGRCLPWRERC